MNRKDAIADLKTMEFRTFCVNDLKPQTVQALMKAWTQMQVKVVGEEQQFEGEGDPLDFAWKGTFCNLHKWCLIAGENPPAWTFDNMRKARAIYPDGTINESLLGFLDAIIKAEKESKK